MLAFVEKTGLPSIARRLAETPSAVETLAKQLALETLPQRNSSDEPHRDSTKQTDRSDHSLATKPAADFRPQPRRTVPEKFEAKEWAKTRLCLQKGRDLPAIQLAKQILISSPIGGDFQHEKRAIPKPVQVAQRPLCWHAIHP